MFKSPVFEVRFSPISADTDLIAVFQDAGKKVIPPKGIYSPLVEKVKKAGAFAARHGSSVYIRFGGKGGAEDCMILGLGPAGELTEEKIRQAAGHAWSKLMAERAKTVSVRMDSFFGLRGSKANDLAPIKVLRAFTEGLALSTYQIQKNSKMNSSQGNDYVGPSKISFIVEEKGSRSTWEQEVQKAQAVNEATSVTRYWSNLPSNLGTPEFYASEARKLAKKYGLKYRVLNERDAAREKMGLFLAVGQGASRESRIVVLEYSPKGKKGQKTLAYVGKGVTFDSGGISIKPALRMEEMKHDMTGAATVMGAMILAAQWRVPNRVLGVMAFTENMPDGNAVQPGNVIVSRAGKTVEIVNTDAEGRLVLADVLDYVQDSKPDAVVDVATLTGAVSIALGKQCCAILGNEETLVESLQRAGDASGERIWELPLYDEYFDDMKSDYADMKNSCNDSYGGVIRGAIFLKQFIRKGVPWAHLDIAATAYNMAHLPYYPKKGASGAYVRTLAQFAAEF